MFMNLSDLSCERGCQGQVDRPKPHHRSRDQDQYFI